VTQLLKYHEDNISKNVEREKKLLQRVISKTESLEELSKQGRDEHSAAAEHAGSRFSPSGSHSILCSRVLLSLLKFTKSVIALPSKTSIISAQASQ